MTNQQGALQYADRDHMDLGSYYMRHVSAMTGEALHSKSAIAAELAHRDREIDRLQAENANLNAGYAAARLEIESLRARSVAPDPRPVVEMCAKALAEELAAWDIDPPLHHVKEAHDACELWLAAIDADRAMRAAQPAGAQQPGDCGNTPYDEGPFALAQQPGVAYAAQRASIPCGPLIDNFPPRPEPAIWHEGGGFYNIYQLELFANATHALRAARVPADSVTAPAGERENLDLRRMLCVAHAGAAAYMDDGEAQDNRDLPLIDFLRDTPAEIQDKLQRRALKKLAAEATAPAAQAADSVLEDAARLDWLLLHISGEEFRRIGVHYSGNASRADVDAARKQGANHD